MKIDQFAITAGTVAVEPTLQNLAVLAVIVAIRTLSELRAGAGSQWAVAVAERANGTR